MELRRFMYWANMPDEEKRGKFMSFNGGLSELQLEGFIGNMSMVESADYIIVPLDQIDLCRQPWLKDVISNAVSVIDVPYMFINSDVMVSNVRDFEEEWN